jgi:hypothetical protein
MLDLVTTGFKNDLLRFVVVTCPPRGGFLRPPALQVETHYVYVPTAVTGYLNLDRFLTGMRSINLRLTRQTVDPGCFVGFAILFFCVIEVPEFEICYIETSMG